MMRERFEHYKEILTLKPAQVLASGFAIVILIGALILNTPYATVSGETVGFINALFTSTSAVCVTGLVVVDTGTYWNRFGQTVIMCLIQIGGLGFMTMGTLIAVILGHRISLKSRLLIQKSLGQYEISGIIRLSLFVVAGTAVIEFIGFLLLATQFVPLYGWRQGLFFSLFHSVSAFCNAGFDIIGNYASIVPFVDNIVINFTIMGLIIIGGLGFTVILDLVKTRHFEKLSLHSKMVLMTTAVLLVSGFVTILACEFSNPGTMGPLSLKGKILSAMFHSVSPRTAGFNSLDMTKLTMATAYITILLMFIGGSPSSTAGGIKTTTLTTMFLSVKAIIQGKEDAEFQHRRLSMETLQGATAVLAVSMTWVVAVSLCLTLTEPMTDFLKILFETVSAFATVGLSLGITGSLSDPGKLLLALTMFAGRVGPITLVAALAGVKDVTRPLYHYPEDKVTIG